MAAAPGASGFLNRNDERERLDTLLADVRAGHSAAVALRGEAGVGKTALLRYAAGQAFGFRTAQIAGVEAEMELPFAGIHQLCAPMLDRLDALPAPQREALRVALGVANGNPPDRFLISLATLSLLSAAAEERPLLCLVDDAQWLDGASAQVLTFVAGGCWPSPSRSCSRFASRSACGISRACRSCGCRGWTSALLTPCSRGPSPAGSMLASATGSSPRRAAIPSRCWSCHAG